MNDAAYEWCRVHVSIRPSNVSPEPGPALCRGNTRAPPVEKGSTSTAQPPAPVPGPYRSSCHQELAMFRFVSVLFLKANVLSLGTSLFKRWPHWLALCHCDTNTNHFGRWNLAWENTPTRLACGKACGRFSRWMIDVEESPDHCGWGHPWAAGPRLSKWRASR